jgi:formylglycine-generating enzyme required for sulfatase activity
MVGDLWEWTEQWVDPATRPCLFWQAILGAEYPHDISCFGGTGNSPATFRNLPGAMIRGGTTDTPGTPAGVLAVVSATTPATAANVGFRCAR